MDALYLVTPAWQVIARCDARFAGFGCGCVARTTWFMRYSGCPPCQLPLGCAAQAPLRRFPSYAFIAAVYAVNVGWFSCPARGWHAVPWLPAFARCLWFNAWLVLFCAAHLPLRALLIWLVWRYRAGLSSYAAFLVYPVRCLVCCAQFANAAVTGFNGCALRGSPRFSPAQLVPSWCPVTAL